MADVSMPACADPFRSAFAWAARIWLVCVAWGVACTTLFWQRIGPDPVDELSAALTLGSEVLALMLAGLIWVGACGYLLMLFTARRAPITPGRACAM